MTGATAPQSPAWHRRWPAYGDNVAEAGTRDLRFANLARTAHAIAAPFYYQCVPVTTLSTTTCTTTTTTVTKTTSTILTLPTPLGNGTRVSITLAKPFLHQINPTHRVIDVSIDGKASWTMENQLVCLNTLAPHHCSVSDLPKERRLDLAIWESANWLLVQTRIVDALIQC